MKASVNCGPLAHFRTRDAAGLLREPWTCGECGGSIKPYTDEQEARVRERIAEIDRARDERQMDGK